MKARPRRNPIPSGSRADGREATEQAVDVLGELLGPEGLAQERRLGRHDAIREVRVSLCSLEGLCLFTLD
jgi:hypothetical protein